MAWPSGSKASKRHPVPPQDGRVTASCFCGSGAWPDWLAPRASVRRTTTWFPAEGDAKSRTKLICELLLRVSRSIYDSKKKAMLHLLWAILLTVGLVQAGEPSSEKERKVKMFISFSRDIFEMHPL